MYLLRDRLGSVVATTLGGGVKGASYRYGVYGALEASSGDAGDAASEQGYGGTRERCSSWAGGSSWRCGYTTRGTRTFLHRARCTRTPTVTRRATTITRQSGTSERLSYDPFGALLSRQAGSAVTYYLGRRATVTGTVPGGCAPSASCAVSVGAVDFHVTLGGGRRIASLRIHGAARTLYYHRDRLGSVVATTRGGGLAGAKYRYSAHGALEVAAGDAGDSASEIGYAGSLRLSGGLLSMGARVYHPGLKIWLQPDPLLPFKYDYAGGDPINRFDPTGLEDVAVPPFKAGDFFNYLNGKNGYSDYYQIITYRFVSETTFSDGSRLVEDLGMRTVARRISANSASGGSQAQPGSDYWAFPQSAAAPGTPAGYPPYFAVEGESPSRPRQPDFDYVSLSGGGCWGWCINTHVTLDRTGYLTGGISFGLGWGRWGVGASAGWIQPEGMPLKVSEFQGYGTGWSTNWNLTIGVGTGAASPISGDLWSREWNIGFPGASATAGYSWGIAHTPWGW